MERWGWANPKTFLKKPSEKPNGVIMGPPSPQTSEPEMEKRNGHLMGDGDGENDGSDISQTWVRHGADIGQKLVSNRFSINIL